MKSDLKITENKHEIFGVKGTDNDYRDIEIDINNDSVKIWVGHIHSSIEIELTIEEYKKLFNKVNERLK